MTMTELIDFNMSICKGLDDDGNPCILAGVQCVCCHTYKEENRYE